MDDEGPTMAFATITVLALVFALGFGLGWLTAWL